MRVLCVGGGASKGAFLGGEYQALLESGIKWDSYVGCSTGSLITALAPLNGPELLKTAYTSVNTKSIFPKVNPFRKNGKLKIANTIWRIITGRKSLGEADGLITLLAKYLTLTDYYNIRHENTISYSTVTNMTNGKTEYFDNNTLPYDEYLKSVVASCSVPLVFEPIEINGSVYLDGGVREGIPIQKAIDIGATEIDVLISRPEKYPKEEWEDKNCLNIAERTVTLLMREGSAADTEIGHLMAKDRNVKIHFYYTPRVLTNNSLSFDKAQMKAWWKEGYDLVKNGKPKSYLLNTDSELKLQKPD